MSARGGEGRGGSERFLTGLCDSRAEFLSLLKNYNYFLKEQTQLQLSYTHVRLSYLKSLKCLSEFYNITPPPNQPHPLSCSNPDQTNEVKLPKLAGSSLVRMFL